MLYNTPRRPYMRTKTQEGFLSILRYEICGTELPQSFAVSDEEALIRLSEKQDLTHLVYDALTRSGVGCGSQKAMSQYYAALWRVEQMDYELGRISELFETHGIDFMPLKGAVMRGMYPQRWMRTSADIDILLRAEQEEEAEALLAEKLGYLQDTEHQGVHHASFFSPENHVHIEPHRMLFHEIHSDKYTDHFRSVWDRALQDPAGRGHRYMLSDAERYAFHIAHMEKHLHLGGGCSVRGLIDLWFLDRMPDADKEGRKRLLEECSLTLFESRMRGLIDAWMDGCPAENEQLEQYVLEGYLYGTTERKAELDIKKQGRLGYFIRRAFMPYKTMKTQYPVLEKHPYLLPVMWPVRWARRMADKAGRARMKTQLKTSLTADEGTIGEIRELSEYLGIE